MASVVATELHRRFETVEYDEFYREIFNDTLSNKELAKEGEMVEGEYIGIATVIRTLKEKNEKGKNRVNTWDWHLYDGLDEVKAIVEDDRAKHEDEERRLTIVSPVSYAGRRRLSENARYLYALCIEIDGLRKNKKGEQVGLKDLLHQCSRGKMPNPTFIVASGTGVHLYYKFEKPVPCFQNVKRSLAKYKKALTKLLWNHFVTDFYEDDQIQYESVFQGFRMVGTRTKQGDICEAFRVGEAVTIEYLNGFVKDKNSQLQIAYKSDLPKAKARELYPEWYEKRVVQGDKAKGHWVCNRAVYDWWLDKIQFGAVVGHRYYCLMCLCIYAIKCDIAFEEVERDCYNLMQDYEDMTVEDSNHFTEEDVESALDIYRNRGDNLFTYPIKYLQLHSGITIEPNKRNGRKMADHLRYARAVKNVKVEMGECTKGGRPRVSKAAEHIYAWRCQHKDGKKAQCIRDTGYNKSTVYRLWDGYNILNMEKGDLS